MTIHVTGINQFRVDDYYSLRLLSPRGFEVSGIFLMKQDV